jgi:hypothetical protein
MARVRSRTTLPCPLSLKRRTAVVRLRFLGRTARRRDIPLSTIRIVAAIFMLASAVTLFASDNPKFFAPPLIIGNLLLLWDKKRSRQTD